MTQFPRRKADIDALAFAISDGLQRNTTEFPLAVFDLTPLVGFRINTQQKVAARQQLEAELNLAFEEEKTAYDEEIEEMKRLLGLAEATHRNDPAKLALIGWGDSAAPRHLPPGQPRALEAVMQGAGEVFLDWKAPAPGSGGAVDFYRVERRIKQIDGGVTEKWGEWDTSVVPSEILLRNQTRGVEIEFRIVAVNTNGNSTASNTMMVVL